MITIQNSSLGCVLISILLIVYGVISYIINIVKLINCDWQLSVSMKHEVIHAIGLIPGVSMITCWL